MTAHRGLRQMAFQSSVRMLPSPSPESQLWQEPALAGHHRAVGGHGHVAQTRPAGGGHGQPQAQQGLGGQPAGAGEVDLHAVLGAVGRRLPQQGLQLLRGKAGGAAALGEGRPGGDEPRAGDVAHPQAVEEFERFGVAECDTNGKVVKLVEKPKVPTSNLASVGLYFYPADVLDKAQKLKPSPRGELEITDLNNVYLKEGRLTALRMSESSLWLDAGTPDSLLEASVTVEKEIREHCNPVGYLEVLALRRGMIDAQMFESLVTRYKTGTPYREKLRHLAFGRDA